MSEGKSGFVMTKNDNILKTAVILCFTAVAITGIVSYYVASHLKEVAKINKEIAIVKDNNTTIIHNNNNNNDTKTVTTDKFTYCMQTMMQESMKGGKFLHAKEAKEICKSLEPSKK